jgi:hypothetical protein
MDLSAYLRVALRYKRLLLVGLLLATAISAYSFLRIGPDGVSYRQGETYLSASTLFVTQAGFPWGRSVLDEMIRVQSAEGTPDTFVPKYGDPGRYSGLAALYAELAKGDAVQREVMKTSGPGEYYDASVVKSVDAGASLPMIYMKGYGPSAEASIAMANRAADAFREYLADQQGREDIPENKRVEVVVTQRAGGAEVFEARSFVRPIFLFLLISMAFLALAFGLENLRPRGVKQAPDLPDEHEVHFEPPVRAA